MQAWMELGWRQVFGILIKFLDRGMPEYRASVLLIMHSLLLHTDISASQLIQVVPQFSKDRSRLHPSVHLSVRASMRPSVRTSVCARVRTCMHMDVPCVD